MGIADIMEVATMIKMETVTRNIIHIRFCDLVCGVEVKALVLLPDDHGMQKRMGGQRQKERKREREKERESERYKERVCQIERERERVKDSKRERVCVCV